MAAPPPGDISGDEEERENHIYVAKKAFTPDPSLDAYLFAFYLSIRVGDQVVVQTRAKEGEWVYVAHFKKPLEVGYVPWDYLNPFPGESATEAAMIEEHKVC